MPDGATRWPALMTLAVHELRTPVTVVTGYVQMLLDGLGGQLGEFERQALQQSAEACARITDMLADMSTLAAIDAGRLTPAVQNATVASLLAEARRRFVPPAGRAVALQVDGTMPDVTVTIDHVRASRGLAALAAAVAVMSRATAEVVVRTTVAAAEVTITFTDPAVAGSPAAPLGPLNELRGGLGVSVPLARCVLEAAGGTVLSSTAPGDPGIVVRLPLAGTE